MSENAFASTAPEAAGRNNYRPGLLPQIGMCFRRLLRRFTFQHEWRYLLYTFLLTLPLALWVRNKFYVAIEWTLIGSFGLVTVGMWIGALNSIQTVCRERNGIRRDKRDGMYVAAYVLATMLYQAILCAAETLVVILIFVICRVPFPSQGLITPWVPFDLAVTMFLVIYASDMLAFLLSSFMPNSVMAMAAVPIFLVIELVFSGAYQSLLPPAAMPIQKIAISSRGLEAINSEADYNALPMELFWKELEKQRDTRFGGKTSLGQLLELVKAENEVHHAVKVIRETEVGAVMTVEEVMYQLRNNPKFEPLRRYDVMGLFEIGELLDMLHETGLLDNMKNYTVGTNFTLGDVIDWLAKSPKLEYFRNAEFGSGTTIGELIDFFGEDEAREFVEMKTAELLHNDAYVKSPGYVGMRWLYLAIFALVYAVAAGVSIKVLTR